jgi:hypothetical protein
VGFPAEKIRTAEIAFNFGLEDAFSEDEYQQGSLTMDQANQICEEFAALAKVLRDADGHPDDISEAV